jgi:hypothetical protein
VEGDLRESDLAAAPPRQVARNVGAASPRRLPPVRHGSPVRRSPPEQLHAHADRARFEPEVAVVRRPTFARAPARPALPMARSARRGRALGAVVAALALALVALATASMVLLLRGEDASPTAIAVQPSADIGRGPAARDLAPAPGDRAPVVADSPANVMVARAWEALMPAGTRPVRTVAPASAPSTAHSPPAKEVPTPRTATRREPADLTAPTAMRSPSPAPSSTAPRSTTLPDEPITQLVAFDSAPFPYDGRPPGSNTRFLNVIRDGHRGHRTRGGRVYGEEVYSDRRVLLHVPQGFDPRQPGVMIVFFHGHGATLARDVRDRQQVPAQISASGLNAVLVAPQFAVDAADSSAGQFWEPGAFKRFISEAGNKLAALTGDARAEQAFAAMPVVIVGYSGGFLPTAYALRRGGLDGRVRGVVLLDGLYGEFDTFANWIANNRSAFFVSAYTRHTSGHNVELEHMLRSRGVPFATSIKAVESRGGVAFIATGSVSHRDFVTHAWADRPLEDLLGRLGEYRAKGAPPMAALSLCGDACR